ncbi:putative Maleylacetate reductase [Talaromyces proteolyticus]|uniref:Maleylacetate reductase n=1 Tax=Talaromyces proteolyticus TaxID=1131652 RepID=A0AAD4KTV4_9EURO|nr:putative Maleylacetate reductase [Talaromyces proteolyticus]KAH8698680.1 putative Maleylacetate reductase [Talaromyces proteolyticus]
MMPTPASDKPLAGLWQPDDTLRNLHYGAGCVGNHLISCLPSPKSGVFIATSNSIVRNTPLLEDLKALLGHRIVGTFAGVKQHVPLEGILEAAEKIRHISNPFDVVLAVGGGSTIDFAKMLASHLTKDFDMGRIAIIAIPTTLSACEASPVGSYSKNGTKLTMSNSYTVVDSILYDPEYSQYTPKRLWLSSGICALSHAVETMYHPFSTEFPRKALASWAMKVLFDGLQEVHESYPGSRDAMTRLFLATYASNSLKGNNVGGQEGICHLFAYALGSPFNIPHAETCCITLGKVIIYKAKRSAGAAKQIARLLPATGDRLAGNDVVDACQVGHRIIALVNKLGLGENLSQRGVSRDHISVIGKCVGRASGLHPDECQPLIDLVESFFQ